MKKPFYLLILFSIMTILSSCSKNNNDDTSNTTSASLIEYTFPDESEKHEGTWLYWPHQYQFGMQYRDDMDATWVAMTAALIAGEKVHIAAYDQTEATRISTLLTANNVPLTNVDIQIIKTDDVWARDSGPIYARDKNGKLIIQDWGFNGWGNKFDYQNCNQTPQKIASIQNKTNIDLNSIMTIEGGAIELDGNGTMLSTKSCVLNSNRNSSMTQAKAQEILTKYYGATNFIWLDGVAGLEITDMHIDGFAKFANKNTLVTMSKIDLLTWDVPQKDIDVLYASKNKDGVAYQIVQLPLTQNNVKTASTGKDLGYQGSYANYYIANKVILVPNYNDPNDAAANAIIQNLYPTRTVVGIDVRNLYENGGMVHCVTQQQPE